MYETIHYFTDLQDFNHPYNVGDMFPRHGMVVSQARLDELASSRNKQGKPLIRLKIEKQEVVSEVDAESQKESEEPKLTKSQINKMSKDELLSIAKGYGFTNIEKATGSELKKALIDYFKL